MPNSVALSVAAVSPANQTPNESLNFGENDENDEDNKNGGVDDANANDTTV